MQPKNSEKPDNWDDYIDWKFQFIVDTLPRLKGKIKNAEMLNSEAEILKSEQQMRDMESKFLVADEYVPHEFYDAHRLYKSTAD